MNVAWSSSELSLKIRLLLTVKIITLHYKCKPDNFREVITVICDHHTQPKSKFHVQMQSLFILIQMVQYWNYCALEGLNCMYMAESLKHWMAPCLSYRCPHISLGSHNLVCFIKFRSIIFHHFAIPFCASFIRRIGPNLMHNVNICSHVPPRKPLNVFQRHVLLGGQRQQLSAWFYFGPYLFSP
jgi:hypothetical protein